MKIILFYVWLNTVYNNNIISIYQSKIVENTFLIRKKKKIGHYKEDVSMGNKDNIIQIVVLILMSKEESIIEIKVLMSMSKKDNIMQIIVLSCQQAKKKILHR